MTAPATTTPAAATPAETAATASPSRRHKRAAAWSATLVDYRQYQLAAGRSPSTVRLRMTYAHVLADFAPKIPTRITTDDLVAFLAKHEDWKATTRSTVVHCLRDLFLWMQKTGRRLDNPTIALPGVRVPPRSPRPCPDHTVATALAATDQQTRLMIEAAAFCGLRRAEIARLHSRDLVHTLEGWAVRILGKGSKVRVVPISDTMATVISASDGWVFPNGRGGHLRPETVGVRVSEALPPGWTCHTLRHRFASAAYRAERDLRAVQDLLGHSSVATTQIYTAIPDDARRRAAAAAQSLAPTGPQSGDPA